LDDSRKEAKKEVRNFLVNKIKISAYGKNWKINRKRDCPSICVNFIIAYPQIKSLSGCRYVANP